MDKPSVNIKYSSFPSQFATESEKESEAYGLSVGKAIESEWFSRVGQSCRYYNSYNDYHTQRLYGNCRLQGHRRQRLLLELLR